MRWYYRFASPSTLVGPLIDLTENGEQEDEDTERGLSSSLGRRVIPGAGLDRN